VLRPAPSVKGMSMRLGIASLLLTCMALAGCHNAGSEYIGKWVSVKSEKRTLEIERNGDSFMLRNTEPSFITGRIETKNIPATLKDGTLQVQLGMGAITLSLDKGTGHLTDGQAEYRRVTDDEFKRLADQQAAAQAKKDAERATRAKEPGKSF
jgi:hypothetical protein